MRERGEEEMVVGWRSEENSVRNVGIPVMN